MPKQWNDVTRLATGLCRGAGIHPPDREDAVADVVRRVWRQPRRRRYPAAVETVRRRLANQIGRSARCMPRPPVELKAVGAYLGERHRAAEAAIEDDSGVTLASFDRHSRRWAAENGVCPQCSRPGRFTHDTGRCACGFAMR